MARPSPSTTLAVVEAQQQERRARRGPDRHPGTVAERAARGKAARLGLPLEAHGEVPRAAERSDPVQLLEQQAVTRLPELVPIRYGRMLASPFAYYRAAALPMADDLGRLPDSGLRVQLCGDAHLSNFGVFGSPERHLVFDVNDFDETLPGPFEWDVKRLAASVEIAGRQNGFARKDRAPAVLAAARSYRNAMHGFAGEQNMTIWYEQLDMDRELTSIMPLLAPKRAQRIEKMMAKARSRTSAQAFAKLTHLVDGQPRIMGDPPLVVPLDDLLTEADAADMAKRLRLIVTSYRRSLPLDRRHLLEQFRVIDVARKVVGVGSVGTRCWIILLVGRDETDPLFLQAKEAEPSVLAAYAGRSAFSNEGERVVAGQRLMQASSDIFLGWQRSPGLDGIARDFYFRQLRDWKGSLPPEEMLPRGLAIYAGLCGWTLARAHARSGDRIAIASYLGKKDVFEHAVLRFATRYADLNDADFSALKAAERSGRIQVQ